MKKSNTVTLVECALMIALSTVLSMFAVFKLGNGGAVTIGSMVPLVLVSYRHGVKWGIGTAFTHSLLQMLLGFNAPPAKTFTAFVAVVLLDYVIAFTVLGTASFFGKPFKNRTVSVAVGAVSVTILRFICSFLSGILIWYPYAPKDMPVWLYSLTYNGSYMLPEMVITAVLSVVLIQVLDRVEKKSVRNA